MSLLTSIFGTNRGGHDEKSKDSGSDTSLFDSSPKEFAIVEKIAPPKEKKRRKAAKKAEPSEDSAAKDHCTVFVGNLPLDTTRKELSHFFRQCGTVESSRIRSAPVQAVKVADKQSPNLMRRVATQTGQLNTDAGKGSVHGYVVFTEEEAVTKAIQLNNSLWPSGSNSNGNDRRVRVDCATPTWTQHTKRAVFVGNLPFNDANGESDLQQHFAKYCGCNIEEIEAVRLVRDKETYHCKGFGYVLFATTDLQANALRTAHESKYKKRVIRVMPCSKKSKQKKSGAARNTMGGKNHPTKPNAEIQKTQVVGALKRSMARDDPKSRKRVRSAPNKPGKPKGKKKAKTVDKDLRKLIQRKVDKVKGERRQRR